MWFIGVLEAHIVWSIGNIGVIDRLVHRHSWGNTSYDLSVKLGVYLMWLIGNRKGHNSGTLSTIFGSFLVWSIGNIGAIHRLVHRHFRGLTLYGLSAIQGSYIVGFNTNHKHSICQKSYDLWALLGVTLVEARLNFRV